MNMKRFISIFLIIVMIFAMIMGMFSMKNVKMQVRAEEMVGNPNNVLYHSCDHFSSQSRVY